MFQQEVLPELLNHVQAPISLRMCVQEDRAPAYYSVDAYNDVNILYSGQWIGLGGPINRPARSPGLSCLDIFF